MTVRNEEKKAFRDLTPDEKLAIIDAKLNGTCEVWNDAWYKACDDGVLCLNSPYRTRPRQLAIPWEVIRPEYKWAAMDECGDVWLHEELPVVRRTIWEGMGKSASAYALNIDTTGIDWLESLTERPEGV